MASVFSNLSLYNISSDMTTTAETTDDPPMSAFRRSLMLTKHQMDTALEIIFIFYYISVALAIPACLCNLIVFLQPSMRGGVSYYVIGMNGGQLISTLINMGNKILADILDTDSYAYWTYHLYVNVYVLILAKRGAYVVMCLASVERLYAIIRPLHSKTFFLSKHSLICTCGAFVLTGLWHTYILARQVVGATGVTPSGKTIYRRVFTDLYKKHKAINDGFSISAKIVLSFGTLVTQLALNVVTVIALRRHNKVTKRVQSSASDEVRRQRERQMTVTIMAATVTYVILSIPFFFHNMIHTFYPKAFGLYTTYHNLYMVLANLSLTLVILSGAIDFVWFLTLSSSYRQTFCSLIRGLTGRKSTKSQVSTNPSETSVSRLD